MNPILESKYYIPDVEARQWDNGKIYLYGSQDISGSDDYCSLEYCVFESEDMEHWLPHPASFTSRETHRQESRNSALYAPDCEKVSDKYCLFYCQENGEEGVAFSDSPVGPFKHAMGIIPADRDGIDPAVLVDDDGSLYYFWGQFNAKGGQLDLNTGRIIPETLTENILTEKEHGFHEGISIRKRRGIYYLVYSDISRGRPTCLGYATSDKPLGPYTKRGIIIDNTGCDPQSWNNHGSIAEINGNWYVFYHRSSHNSNFSRRVCVEPIRFNEDGTINEVEMTTQGQSKPIDAFAELDAERACCLKGKCFIEDHLDGVRDFCFVANLHDGDCLTYKYFRFDREATVFCLVASVQYADVTVQLGIDSEENYMGEISLTKTAGKYDFQEFRGTINGKWQIGIHSIHITVRGRKGSLCCLKSICFL